jgi:isopropylmalate/homocitrate/citramalate synthase
VVRAGVPAWVDRPWKLLDDAAGRASAHIVSAVDAGADAVLVTCSSIGRAAEIARSLVSVPVIRVDEAMADEAVQLGS